MKKFYSLLIAVVVGMLLFAGINYKPALPYGMQLGTPEIKSITALTFGPSGILFLGDSQNASVISFDTKDTKAIRAPKSYDLKNVNQKIAEVLGTTKENITINDMAVNPVSKQLYLAVKSSDGTPVLLTLSPSNEFKVVSLKDIAFSTIILNNAPSEEQKDRRGRSLRISSISDLGFANGKLMVSGLNNKEFSSSFRSISFPFTGKQEDESTLEMYHTSHGRFETTSPVRTFSTTTINGKDFVVASYTCTPLVLFAVDEMKPGATVKGRTIAEMGNQNTPTDMIWLKEDGQNYLVMANDNRPAAKVSHDEIQKFQGALTERIPTTGGVNFTVTPHKKVLQLDKLDDSRAVLIQQKENGDIDLWTTDGKSI
ncbi:MAG: hypothetical protein EOO07_07975 [Chitinophagaceae bacterium]|nr:MAG: hypothetical protein EOO07_07975 [Chitinophagaceae bacterium]